MGRKPLRDKEAIEAPPRLPSLRGLGMVGASRVLSGVGVLAVDSNVDLAWLSEATGCTEDEVKALVSEKAISYSDTTKGTARAVIARVFARSILVYDAIMRDAVAEYVRAVALEEQIAGDIEKAKATSLPTEQLEDFLAEARAKKHSTGYRMLDLHRDISKIMQNLGMSSLFVTQDKKPLTPTDQLLAKKDENGDESANHDALLDEVAVQMNEAKQRVIRFVDAVAKKPDIPVENADINSQNT